MAKVQVLDYDLPDSYLYKRKPKNTLIKIWIPEEKYIVLGRSNNLGDSLLIENVLHDKIPIYKRPSGGETVILTPKTIVISIVFNQEDFKGGKTYFNLINTRIKVVLNDYGIKNVDLKGISDLAINDVKILGSSLYQNKDVVFYHAVLNVAENSSVFERYLKHPQKEPDYRKKRTHSDFVTSLEKEEYNVNTKKLVKTLVRGLNSKEIL